MRAFFNLVFSNNLKFRITRHVLFWMLWISFFAFVESYRFYELMHINFWSYFPIAWGEMLIQIPIDIAFCYSVIYFLLPKFFLKGRYFEFITGWLILVFTAAILQDLYFYSAISSYRIWFGLQPPIQHGSIFLGALEIVGSLNTEGGFAIAIKFGKMFAVKQKEAQLLSQEKRKLEKTFAAKNEEEIKPTFLFNVLNRLYSRSQEKDININDSLKKINSLILYTSYDAKKTLVPLAKEIESLKEYIELEKISYDYAVKVTYDVNGNAANKLIAPYILIPIVEYFFTNIGNGTVTNSWLTVDINIQGNDLTAKFCSSKSADTSTLLGDKNLNIQHIEQRLKLLYPGGYQMKKIIEPQKLLIELYINLSMLLGR